MKRICIDINGKEVCGHIEISGVRKLRFTVYYNGREKTDAKDYRPDQEGYLMVIAHQILREMVTSDI